MPVMSENSSHAQAARWLSRSKGIRAGKAFVSAPRTFAGTDSGANTGCGADDGIGMTDLSKQMIAGGRAGGDRGRSGRALVAVMKPADLGDGDDRPG